MRTIQEDMSAGEILRLSVAGKYFRILSNPSGTLDVKFFKNNTTTGENAIGVGSGYYAEPQEGFDTIEITSAVAQTIKFAISRGQGGYDIPPSGQVTVTNVNGAFTQGRASVTNANQAIIAANANRRYLQIQNNDATQTLRVTLDGNAATASQGLRVLAGQSLELQGFVCTNAINVMMEVATATNNNVEFVSA